MVMEPAPAPAASVRARLGDLGKVTAQPRLIVVWGSQARCNEGRTGRRAGAEPLRRAEPDRRACLERAGRRAST
jgi:hypothetical protein